ncbi:MAG: hypothetical protein IPJ51_21120 [Saprospiraceae bacterium]|nr:hypothetical protein [Saprospiraceae bacterium]
MRIQLLALVIQLMIQINLKSQDTLDIDIDPTQEPLFLKNYESLQLNKEDISRMWLIGLADLGVEQRLFHKFSIKGSINTFSISPYFNKNDFTTDLNFNFGGAHGFVNFYPISYSKSSQKTNLSGLYLGVGYGIYYADQYQNAEDFNIDSIKLLFTGKLKNFGRKTAITHGAIFAIGFQQRIFDVMYYNFRLNFANLKTSELNPDNYDVIRTTSRLYLIPSLDLGISLHSKRKKYNFVNYHQSKAHLIKFDFLRILEFTNFKGHGLNASYEQLLPNNPISIVGGLDFSFFKRRNYSDIHFTVTEGYSHNITNVLFGEVRYYYNLEKRRLAGKVGNGLSANYLAVNLAGRHKRIRKEYDDQSPTENSNLFFLGIEILYGIQREIGDHLYLDLRVGLRPVNISFSEINSNKFRVPERTFGLFFGFTK